MRIVLSFFLVPFSFGLLGCGSIPNLESPVCSEARNEARQFYLFHIDKGTDLTVNGIRERERFLTPRLAAELVAVSDRKVDPFTMFVEPPTTFKIAECEESAANSATFKIQLYWRSDALTRQEEVRASFVKQGEKWLLDGVSSKAR